MDQAVLERASQADSGAELDLTVWLRPRPGALIAREVRRERLSVAEARAEEIRDVHRSVRSTASLSPQEERSFLASVAASEGLLTRSQRDDIRARFAQLEADLEAARAEIHRRIREAVAADQAAIAARVGELGGEVIAPITTQNAVSIRLPAAQLPLLAQDPLVARIIALPPVVPELDQQAASLGLTTGFWPDGITGGLFDVGLLDSGVQHDHPALAGVPTMSLIGLQDPDGHGTACAGALVSNDPTYRGGAYGVDKLLLGSYSSSLVMPHADWMVSTAWDDPEAINLSGSYGMADGVDYSVFDQFWDGLVDDNSVTVATSAGNEGDAPLTLTHPATAYNLLAVANMDDRDTVSREDDRIAPSSSRGPSPGGRKKPDVAAPGTNTRSTHNDWDAGPDFLDFTGSSMAATHVTAGAVLLADLRGSDNPMAIKAVLLNTADSWSDGGTSADVLDDGPAPGSGWNKTYGWGYLDLWEAWYNGLDVFLGTISASPPDFRLYTGLMYGGEKATLVWNRHVGYDGSNYPTAVEKLTDLDLAVYNEVTGARLAGSDSAVDNVEQVAVGGPSVTRVVLKVEVFGSVDPDVGSEPFALATEENFVAASLPVLAFTHPYIGPVSPNQPFLLPVGVVNRSRLTAHDNAVEIELPAGFTRVEGPNPWSLGAIAPDRSREVAWTVRAPCGTGRYAVTRLNTSESYGERSANSAGRDVDVATTQLPVGNPVAGQTVPQTYRFSFTATDWSAVGLNPRLRARDLATGDEMCLVAPYQTSSSPGAGRDFTVTNGHLVGAAATHYTVVKSPAAHIGQTSSYVLEHDLAHDQAADTTSPGHVFRPSHVLEVFESPLVAGKKYDATVEITAGTTDVALFVFRAGRMSGSRANADFAVDSGGAGVDEALSFVAPVSGVYAFVVVNENAQGSTFDFRLKGDLLFRDGFEAGDTSAWSAAQP